MGGGLIPPQSIDCEIPPPPDAMLGINFLYMQAWISYSYKYNLRFTDFSQSYYVLVLDCSFYYDTETSMLCLFGYICSFTN